nr:DUF2256 domain-containing protein [Piscinibacter sakaiensis]
MPEKPSHRGNKSSLPSKPCATCGRPMSWRRAWARCWDEVRHCSDACRARRGRSAAPGPAAPSGGGR